MIIDNMETMKDMIKTHDSGRRNVRQWAIHCRLIAICALLAGISQFLMGGCDPTDDIGYTITIVATDGTAEEADLSPGMFEIRISRWLLSDLTVHYSVGGSATSGIDYDSIHESVVIPAGYKSVFLIVNPNDDALDEGNYEDVIVTISVPDGYSSSNRAARVKIIDDDDPVIPEAQITASDSTAEEGGDSGQFRITLNAFPAADIAVRYTVTGTADSADYDDTVLATGSVTIAANTSSAVAPE